MIFLWVLIVGTIMIAVLTVWAVGHPSRRDR